MMSRKTPFEITVLPENSAEITMLQSTIEVSSRRKKTLALEGSGRAGGVSGGMEEEVNGRDVAV
jgi:hypothetical protein